MSDWYRYAKYTTRIRRNGAAFLDNFARDQDWVAPTPVE